MLFELHFDRGLLGPLVVEECDLHVEYDRDVVVFDDYSPVNLVSYPREERTEAWVAG
ncbi:multicopper oxidase type 3 [Halogeometricum pallidum JCM 14848]|uniref:Multicopper oxidase type 3 n=1 Tax=Halogeometricum pallidum JCM 14848 TaxID=1227487 RepID=M0DD33_HALPD|nr:multicopper oxidase type 3 [Halogeometricum pallidum JCM 14848]